MAPAECASPTCERVATTPEEVTGLSLCGYCTEQLIFTMFTKWRIGKPHTEYLDDADFPCDATDCDNQPFTIAGILGLAFCEAHSERLAMRAGESKSESRGIISTLRKRLGRAL